MLAALASAAMPGLAVSGVKESGQANRSDDQAGIDHAVIQDTTGRSYEIFASSSKEGRARLTKRAEAAQALGQAHALSGLGFAIDHVLAFSQAGRNSPSGDYTVMIMPAIHGQARPLDLLTLDDCASAGTTLAAIHRQRPQLSGDSYPSYTTGQIRTQLTDWINKLRHAGHIPPAITSSWARIIETDGLWSFSTCFVHGGFTDGDLLFSGSTITSVTNWQNMQINDPARDLAWIFAKLNEEHRNALMSAYGRMMGARLDGLILLRANLWLQMEQVGDFIEALRHADTPKIMDFKAQVEHLAHQLTVVSNKQSTAQSEVIAATEAADVKRAKQAALSADDTKDAADVSDQTDSAEVTKRSASHAIDGQNDDTVSHEIDSEDRTSADAEEFDDDSTSDSDFRTRHYPDYPDMPEPSSSETMILAAAYSPQESGSVLAGSEEDDDSENDAGQSYGPEFGSPEFGSPESISPESGKADRSADSKNVDDATNDDLNDPDAGGEAGEEPNAAAPTLLIPIFEEQERALRNAREGLEEYEEHRSGEFSKMRETMDESQKSGDSEDSEDSEDSKDSKDSEKSGEAEDTNDVEDSGGLEDQTPDDSPKTSEADEPVDDGDEN